MNFVTCIFVDGLVMSSGRGRLRRCAMWVVGTCFGGRCGLMCLNTFCILFWVWWLLYTILRYSSHGNDMYKSYFMSIVSIKYHKFHRMSYIQTTPNTFTIWNYNIIISQSIIIMIIRTIILLALCFATATATIVITSPLQTEFTNNELNYLYLNFG